jgi:hypothetical protein
MTEVCVGGGVHPLVACNIILIQRILRLCLGLAMVEAGSGYSAEHPTNAKYTQTKNGVQLRATLPTHRRSGESVPLQVELKNGSPGDIGWVETTRDSKVIHLSVEDGGGKKLKSKRGDKQPDPKGTPKIERYRLVLRTVHPQETESWKIDLAEEFVLPPGSYTVSLSIGLNPPDIGTLELADMRLTVSARP